MKTPHKTISAYNRAQASEDKRICDVQGDSVGLQKHREKKNLVTGCKSKDQSPKFGRLGLIFEPIIAP